jgi:hypothetical protein
MFLKLDRWPLCEDERSAFCSSLCRRLAWLCGFGSPGTEKVVIITNTMILHVPYKCKDCTKRSLRRMGGGQRYCSTHPRRGLKKGGGGECHPPAAFPPGKETRDSLHRRRGGWGGGGLDGSRKSRVGIRNPKWWTCDELLYRLSCPGRPFSMWRGGFRDWLSDYISLQGFSSLIYTN